MLIAQITDTHIVEKNEYYLSPLSKTQERLVNVVAYLNEMDNRPDVVLHTGDLTERGSLQSYYHLKELLTPLEIPFFVIPGNHDSRQEMRQVFADQAYMPSQGFIHYVVDDFPVRLICMDSQVENEDFGQVCKERYSWLEEVLKTEPIKPCAIFMHHPPVKTGTKLFDQMNCIVTPDFEYLISNQNNLIGIFAGHYHHFCVSSFGGKQCFIAPSVAPVHYFKHPDVDNATGLEFEHPAITLHQWHGKNIVSSHIVRVKEQYDRIEWSNIENQTELLIER